MIEAFIENTNRATSKEEVYELFLKALSNFGYDRTIYTYITDQPDLNKEAEHGIVTNYPDEWMDRYFSSDYIKNDPTFKKALIYNGPFSWDSLSKLKEFTKIEKQIMDEANEINLFSGVGVSIHGHFGNLSGLGIASSYEKSEPDLDTLRKLNALSRQFHLAYSDHNQDTIEEKKIKLSAREREILLWAAEGKSDPVIAELLEIKHSTVRFHIQNVFKKLGVNERTMAVVKAIKMRLISPSYIGFPYKG
jgi:DNA-binding CsgD family transcriptional regulator